MSGKQNVFRVRRGMLAILAAGLVAGLFAVESTHGEDRKFVVKLAYSPKSSGTGGQPGLPPGGLFSRSTIHNDYFDRTNPNIDSFVEYWEEISYGDVVITGNTFDWVPLPWPFLPPPGSSPATPISLRAYTGSACSPLGPHVENNAGFPFQYGAGEEFCDCFGSGEADTALTPGSCGALIITNIFGELPNIPPPTRGPGLDDYYAVGVNVWTPGERFLDLNGDNRWDGLDEVNNMMCHGPDGCQERRVCNVTRVFCRTLDDCPCVTQDCAAPPVDTACTFDPIGHGPTGCNERGCGDLSMPWMDWDNSLACNNCPGDDPTTFSGCTIPDLVRCGRVDASGVMTPFRACPPKADRENACRDDGFCSLPLNCAVPTPGSTCQTNLLPCCADLEPGSEDDCSEGTPGVNCGSANTPTMICCEFDDFDQNGTCNAVEPFEDFMVRYEPSSNSPAGTWVRVTDDYIRNNYPGDVDALLRRTGNGYYDSPDLFFDRGNTKMIQDAGANRVAWRTPKPGARPQYAAQGETAWFDSFWEERYGTTPPPWPGNDTATPPRNSPTMTEFDPANPTPAGARTGGEDESNRIWFRPNRGGLNGFGRGIPGDINLPLDLGTNTTVQNVLPEEVFGFYDGWVEHDDLGISIYHSGGDQRLGEITSPTTDEVFIPSGGGPYTAIFGADLGPHMPGSAITQPDGFGIAAGPGAVNVHGSGGYDAGDVCIVEWLTWRRDGESLTPGTRWDAVNGGTPIHPFAGAATPRLKCSGSGNYCRGDFDCEEGEFCNPDFTPRNFGFRDYNLDGKVDQGEVRPPGPGNYSVDSNPFTPNNGTQSDYPFNRRRMLEDVVAALDHSVDWNDYVSDNPHHNTISGIVIVPPGSYDDINLFPFAPGYYPIRTRDGITPRFHDLVICQDCREFPSAVRYAAHEYLHTWEGYPDLYDYDRLDPSSGHPENCPIGAFDIMADGGLVHPVAPLKESSGWIRPVDLETVLTPGVQGVITLPPAELVRENSYYYLQNVDRLGEAYWFWSAGSGMGERLPGPPGVLILHTDFGANPDALPLQQRFAPFNYRIVQADGRNDLEECTMGGNRGDAGDLWPGSTGATEFNFNTTPAATWGTLNRWSGLDISNIVTDGQGSAQITLTYTPTSIPSLRFIDPPGGESVGGIYQVRYEATDVFGGTSMQFFFTKDADEPGGPIDISTTLANRFASRPKTAPGTVRQSVSWNIAGVPDGRYRVFAKLIPGPGTNQGFERASTDPKPGRNNVGNGGVTIQTVDVGNPLTTTARSETWVMVATEDDPMEFRVSSSLTQPAPDNDDDNPYPRAEVCPAATADCTPFIYESTNGEVRFFIKEGAEPFAPGDRFHFTTTGITAVSQPVVVLNGRISESPRAVIKASPLTGAPPLTVNFDGRDSRDPEGRPLTFFWTFGDGATATGATTSHTYNTAGTFTVVLRVTNSAGNFNETAVDIEVINSRPTAEISAAPTSGIAPLEVTFNAAGSRDLETPPSQLIYQWNFGDGNTANNAAVPGDFIQVTHVYTTRADGTACTPAAPCLFTASLTVTDTGGKSHTVTMPIRVGNTNPVPVVSVQPTQGHAPLEVRFNAISSTDPDGDTITVDWSFGDGQTALNLPLTGQAGRTDGQVLHTYQNPGTYTPAAMFKDNRGGQTLWIGPTITVVPPLIGPSDPTALFCFPENGTCDPNAPIPALRVGVEFTVDGSASFDRPPGGTITSYTWNWGDSSATSTGVVASHTYQAPGNYTITLTVADGETPPNTGQASRTVNVSIPVPDPNDTPNTPPVAIITTGPRTGTAPASLTFDGRASYDPDGDALEYRWEFRQNGTLIDTMAGAVVTRVFASTGTFQVELSVSDRRGGISRAGPENILITSRILPPVEPPPTQPTPPDIEDSAQQRPGAICGLGMIMGVFGSLFGLMALRATRRNGRRNSA